MLIWYVIQGIKEFSTDYSNWYAVELLDSSTVALKDVPYFTRETKTCSLLLLCSKHCSFSPFLSYLQRKFILQLQGIMLFISRLPLRCPTLSLTMASLPLFLRHVTHAAIWALTVVVLPSLCKLTCLTSSVVAQTSTHWGLAWTSVLNSATSTPHLLPSQFLLPLHVFMFSLFSFIVHIIFYYIPVLLILLGLTIATCLSAECNMHKNRYLWQCCFLAYPGIWNSAVLVQAARVITIDWEM